MPSIDRAALLEQLGHDEAAKLLRAIDSTDDATPPAEPPPAAAAPRPAWEIAEDARRAEGEGLLDQMRAKGIVPPAEGKAA